MAIDIDYTGQFLGGYNKGRQQSFENTTVTNAADAAKQTEQKRMLADQFSQQIKQVTDILKNTDDPVRREAVIKALDQAKAVYTGAEAQQYGLADMFAKQIDFAKETPFEVPKASADPYAATYAREKAKLDAKQPMTDEKAAAANEERAYKTASTMDSIDKALGKLEGNQKYLSAGPIGQATQYIRSTPAGDLDSYLDSIKAALGFEELEKMRKASPTGGALGSITEKELKFLQSVQAQLDAGMQPETLKENLIKIRESYQRVLDNIKAGGGSIDGFAPMDGADPLAGIQPVEMLPTGDLIAPPAPPGGYGNVNDTVPSIPGNPPAAKKRIRFDAQGNMIQ